MPEGFSEKLNAILADPDAMGRIMSLAQSLDGGSEQRGEAPDGQTSEAAAPEETGSAPPDLSGLLGAFGGGEGLDPRLLGLAGRLLTEWNRPDDHRTALLSALRPYVKPERYAKVDRAIQVAKLSRLIRVALSALREGGEDV